MGWLFQKTTMQELVKRLVATEVVYGDDGKEKGTITTLAHCVRGNVLWAVQKYSIAAGEKVEINCFLLETHAGSVGYKGLCESMGPYYYSCPLSYLNMAPEKNADWREKVRKYHAIRKGPDLEKGDVLHLAEVALNGEPLDRVIYDRKEKGKLVVRAVNGAECVLLKRFFDRIVRVEKPGAA